MLCGQTHGSVEEVSEGLAEVVQHKFDLLPEKFVGYLHIVTETRVNIRLSPIPLMEGIKMSENLELL